MCEVHHHPREAWRFQWLVQRRPRRGVLRPHPCHRPARQGGPGGAVGQVPWYERKARRHDQRRERRGLVGFGQGSGLAQARPL